MDIRRRCKKCGEIREIPGRPFSLNHRLRCKGDIEIIEVEGVVEAVVRLRAELARLRDLVPKAFDEGFDAGFNAGEMHDWHANDGDNSWEASNAYAALEAKP